MRKDETVALEIRPIIRGPAYELGEREATYRDALHFSDKIDFFELVDDSALWGWGSFFKSGRDREELAVRSAQRSLAQAGCSSNDIDAAILCGTEFPASVACHARFCREVLSALNLGHAFFVGVTLGRCNTMLSAIQLAQGLTRTQAYRNVLIVASDQVVDEEKRFQKFALFSDAAASCIVSSEPSNGYVILAAAAALDPAGMDTEGEISAQLGRSANDSIKRQCGLGPEQVSTVFPSNLFRPIVKIKEQQAGFRLNQLFMKNIAARGHCFSADPIVNLVDCVNERPLDHGQRVMLASSVPGARACILAEVWNAD